ncbi:MAG: DNA-binding transcriptional LysR family regulator [Motiliproteus sp.]|jgi:DNA-binding transcriptional LysR family regulator
MDKLTSMLVFCRVATSGNFSKAARELRISPAMVTKHIASLEGLLGIRLLNRTTRKVSMTEAGESYLRLCQNLLSEIEEGESALSELSHHPSGTLKLTAPIDFGVLRLAPAIAGYLQRYPDVSIDINYQDLKINLVEDGFDIAIRIGALSDSSLVAVPLMKQRLICCASPAYLQQQGLPKHPTELRQHNCLTYSHSATNNDWHFSKAGESYAIKASGRLNANNGHAMAAVAAQGGGIILKPQFIVQDLIARGELVAILEDYQLPPTDVYAVYPHRRFLPAKMRSFIDYLKAHFQE